MAEEPFPIERRFKADPCSHARTILYSNERTVYCRDCETKLDPFEVLSDLVAHLTDYDSRRDRVQAEVNSLNERADEAKRAMKRAQAARSRMRQKWEAEGDDFDAIVAMGDKHRRFQFPAFE